jgi:hypothetical protein
VKGLESFAAGFAGGLAGSYLAPYVGDYLKKAINSNVAQAADYNTNQQTLIKSESVDNVVNAQFASQSSAVTTSEHDGDGSFDNLGERDTGQIRPNPPADPNFNGPRSHFNILWNFLGKWICGTEWSFNNLQCDEGPIVTPDCYNKAQAAYQRCIQNVDRQFPY